MPRWKVKLIHRHLRCSRKDYFWYTAHSPLSRSRVTVIVWESGSCAFRPACNSQLRTRLGKRPQRSWTGRLIRSSTYSPNANSRENKEKRLLVNRAEFCPRWQDTRSDQNPVADWQTFRLTTCNLAVLYILD